MMRRLAVVCVTVALTAIPAAPAIADDASPSPSPSASASPTPTDTSSASASPSDEPSQGMTDPREGTLTCNSDGSSCEVVRDCEQEAYVQGFDPADYCATPAPDSTSDDTDDSDVVEFPYTPEELDALPDDSPLLEDDPTLTDGDWLAVLW